MKVTRNRSFKRKDWEKLLKSTEGVCWAFLGVRTIDFIDVSFLMPIDLLLTGDFGEELNLLKHKMKIFSLETQEIPFVRKDWITESFDTHLSSTTYQALVGYLRQKLQVCDRICFVCYGTPRLLEELQIQFDNRIKILSPTSQLRKLFSNKLFQYDSFQRLGLPVPLTESTSLEWETYSRLANKFGDKFVVHLAYSVSGSGTFFCDNQHNFEMVKKRFPKAGVAISSFIDGLSLNMHAVVIDYRERLEVVPSQPSIQLVGVKGLTRRRTVWSGNDFASAYELLDKNAVKRMVREIEAIGKWMGSKGWRGLFGVDFIKDHSNEIFPVDINARFQGSTQVLVESCLKSSMIPITLLHVLQFLGCPISSELLNKIRSQVFQTIPGAILVLHNLTPTRTRIRKTIRPGVYSINNDGKMIFKRNGYSLNDCTDFNKKELVITSGVPGIGTYIDVDCPIHEVQTWNGVVEKSGAELNPWGKTIVCSISSLIHTCKEGEQFTDLST